MLPEKIEKLLMLIPKGKVTTYAAVANILNTSPRTVGRILGKNRFPIIVPCHRVVRSDGSLGGYSGPGRVRGKNALLALEGITFLENGRISPSCILREDDLRVLLNWND